MLASLNKPGTAALGNIFKIEDCGQSTLIESTQYHHNTSRKLNAQAWPLQNQCWCFLQSNELPESCQSLNLQMLPKCSLTETTASAVTDQLTEASSKPWHKRLPYTIRALQRDDTCPVPFLETRSLYRTHPA